MTELPTGQPPAVFETVIMPHRSLSPAGMRCVIGLVMLLLGLVVLRFCILGAWPVVAFSLLEVPLLALLLALNMRSARASEMIVLSSGALTVTRSGPDGKQKRFTLSAAWLRLTYEPGARPSRLLVSSGGVTQEIGGFLSETEKEALYVALACALTDVRNPRFDNPQLRDIVS